MDRHRWAPSSPFQIKPQGRAKHASDVVKIFFDSGTCPNTAAVEASNPQKRLVFKKTVGKGRFALAGYGSAQEVPGKVGYCGYLISKGGSIYAHASKTVTVK